MSNPEQTPIIDIGPTFRSAASRIEGERDERLESGKRALSFGVQYLDASLGGISIRDMILVGAKTGIGKTTLASIIAETNAEKGKRVHYFALEAEDREIERRIKFRVLSFIAFQHGASREMAKRMNYLDWSFGRLDGYTKGWEGQADEYIKMRYATLNTFYRFGDFTAEDLAKTFLAIQDQTDLIVLDHLHMVDSDDPSENRGLKLIVKELRDVAIEIGKPVVVVAHLRKAERRSKQLVPDIDDFHGTSDISKLVTKAVLIAPAFDQPTERPHLWNTYIRVAKCRPEGSRTRYVGLVPFNVQTGRYEKMYELGRLIDNGEKYEPIDMAQYPSWALTDA